MHEWIDGWIGGTANGWMGRWMDGTVDGWMGGGWINGCTDDNGYVMRVLVVI